jgi:CO/xanthine dehydrogenase Mo-binding subunit
MDRRHFLKVSTSAAGGLVLALQLPASRVAAAAESAGTTFAPNAFVRIEPDGRIHFTCHRSEMGQDVHTSLAMLVAEELGAAPESFVVAQAPADPVFINTAIGAQITGGSTSVREAWLPLRRAGAAARTLLVGAAARQWGLDPASLRVENGAVFAPDGRRLDFGQLAGAAATLPTPDPEKLALKDPKDFRVIGSRTQRRLDTAAKLDGTPIYGIDVARPGMLWAALAQCPVIDGTVKSVDSVAAKAMPGVRHVVDIGDGVAVLADHFWQAKKARDALRIEWHEGAGAGVSNATIWQALRDGAAKPGIVAKANGNVAAGLAGAAQRLEADYELPLLAHATLEPQNCVAVVADGRCEVWASTQFPEGAKGIAAARSGVDPARVSIHSQFIGGGFGRRLEVDFVGQAAAIARALPGTPVKLVWTREDDTTHDYYRPASLHRLRGGLDAAGKLVALDHQMVSQSVTARAFPGAVTEGKDPFMLEGAENLTYSVPNLRSTAVIQDTGVRVGYWRSVSNALNAFAFEGFIDELAVAAGRDPVAFRLELLAGQPRQRKVLERAAQVAGWGTAGLGKDRALGCASMECYGTHVAVVAEVERRAGKGVHCTRMSFVVDPGIAVHPDQVVAQVQSAAITGLIGCLKSEITLANGRVQEQNFDRFQLLRMSEAPRIDVEILASGDAPGGMGEVGTPLVAPALANALAALTGQRVRRLPFSTAGVEFV